MSSNISEYLAKAETLIEALPYIRKFSNKIVVVKYGGSAMLNEELQEKVIQDIALLKLVGMKPVIVHGGGKEISRLIDRLGMETQFVNGLRVTDEETMEVAEMVLNKVNKGLVQKVEKLGVKAAGICGKDASTLICEKKLSDGADIGYVGNIVKVNTELIDSLIESDFIPVIAPIGMDRDFKTYNINADDAACAIATAIGAEKLAFLTDIEGVCRDVNDSSTLISILTLNSARKLIEEGFVGGGMLPKINNCIEAVENGVSRVHILDGRKQHCLLMEFFTNKGIGTAIIKDNGGLENEELY